MYRWPPAFMSRGTMTGQHVNRDHQRVPTIAPLQAAEAPGGWAVGAVAGCGVGAGAGGQEFTSGISASSRQSWAERSVCQRQRSWPWISRTPTAPDSRCKSCGTCCMRGTSSSPRCFCCRRSWHTTRGECPWQLAGWLLFGGRYVEFGGQLAPRKQGLYQCPFGRPSLTCSTYKLQVPFRNSWAQVHFIIQNIPAVRTEYYIDDITFYHQLCYFKHIGICAAKDINIHPKWDKDYTATREFISGVGTKSVTRK